MRKKRGTRAIWGRETAQDLSEIYGSDAVNEWETQFSESVTEEIDKEILKTLERLVIPDIENRVIERLNKL